MKQVHKGQYKITTRKRRTVGYACSLEQAEYIKDQGVARLVWVWDNVKGRYV